jgi:hypothetical protein
MGRQKVNLNHPETVVTTLVTKIINLAYKKKRLKSSNKVSQIEREEKEIKKEEKGLT